jgi:hypothetical protein
MTNFSAFVLKRDNEILEEFNRLLDKNYKLKNRKMWCCGGGNKK